MKFGRTSKFAALAATTALLLTACGAGTSNSGNAGETQPTTGQTAEGTTNPGTDNGEPKELVLAARVEPNSYDSSQAHVGHSLLWFQSVYDTLLYRDTDGTIQPMLATEWSYDAEETLLTLDLRSDVTFSDGEAFDAEAAVANIEHFRTANGPQAAQMTNVAGVEAVDEDTIAIQLTERDPALVYYLSQAAGMMGSPAALGTEEMSSTPVGSGPYVLVPEETVRGSQYVYEAREDYWNPELQHWDKLTFHPARDFTAVLNGLVSGQFHGGMLDPQIAGQADSAGLELAPNEVDWQGLALFDRDGEMVPGLADVRVRQAINHAIDRQTLLDQIMGSRGTATEQILAPDSDGYVAELEGRYPYDPEKARELLAEAGHSDDIVIQAPTGAGFEAVLAALTQQFADVGITLEQVATPQENLAANIRAGHFPTAVFNFAMSATPWISAGYMVGPNGTYNPFGTEVDELNVLIEELRNAGDDVSGPAQEITRYVVENAWFAPLYRVEQPYYVNSDVVTVTPMPNQAAPSVYHYLPAN